MFGLGGMEILVVLLVGVVVLGPERLPKVMRTFTKLMSDFRRVSTELQRTINAEINLEEYNRKQQLARTKQPGKKKKKKKAAAPKTGGDTPAVADAVSGHSAPAETAQTPTAEQGVTPSPETAPPSGAPLAPVPQSDAQTGPDTPKVAPDTMPDAAPSENSESGDKA